MKMYSYYDLHYSLTKGKSFTSFMKRGEKNSVLQNSLYISLMNVLVRPFMCQILFREQGSKKRQRPHIHRFETLSEELAYILLLVSLFLPFYLIQMLAQLREVLSCHCEGYSMMYFPLHRSFLSGQVLQ